MIRCCAMCGRSLCLVSVLQLLVPHSLRKVVLGKEHAEAVAAGVLLARLLNGCEAVCVLL